MLIIALSVRYGGIHSGGNLASVAYILRKNRARNKTYEIMYWKK